jgi:hypothetical protein
MYRQWFSDAGDSDAHGGERADYSVLSPEHYYVGTPDDILAAITESQQRLGYEELIFWARPPGMPAEHATASLELIARHVLPALRDSAPQDSALEDSARRDTGAAQIREVTR